MACAGYATQAAPSAASPFPALDRQAVQVHAPGRAVLLASAMAGTRVVAVGERGIVALSDDAAVSWRQAKSVPVGVTLTALYFVDAKKGWAVGHGGVILKTEDGGETWVRQTDGRVLAKLALSAAQARAAKMPADAAVAAQLRAAQLLVEDGPDKPLLGLHFDDANHGYVVGSYNLFFETRDGGATWASLMDRLDNPKGSHLYAIGVQGNTIVIAGEQGTLFRSQDAGASFKPLASPYKGSWFSVVMLRDKSLVLAGLRGNALYSSDQGDTWSRIEGAPPVSFFGGASLSDGEVLLSNQAGQILKTRAGAPFTQLSTQSLLPLAGLMPLPGGGLLAVGVTGAIRLPPSESKKPAASSAAISK
ncbi:hypothetical protein GTP46_27010 [Duganella sp. FT135W]|uniref:Photosynthesis system II assembly factor Ycf48/Hcf136-like domain-containing protein n=2 Tax=Duganella flavida TaxID=2692175 RepID=A0A6L8KFV3_9BURK|nr:hypothetical protein [Duganella flavida]